MDSLVAVGTSAALLYSLYNTFQTAAGNTHAAHNLYYESAAVVLALVLLGKYLEEHSKNSAKAAISSLATLIPQKATILKDGKKIEVDTSEIQNGDTVLVTPGEKISVDGEVLEGEADVDEAMLTGESVPVFKSAGETVSGGTICKDGMLKIRATGVGSSTAVAQIIKLVSEAQARKAPVARLADTISGIFVPSVIAIAVVSVIIWGSSRQRRQFSVKYICFCSRGGLPLCARTRNAYCRYGCLRPRRKARRAVPGRRCDRTAF